MKRIVQCLLCASQVLALTFLLPFWAASGAVLAGNWPQFRGPNASGLDTTQALPTTWDLETGKNVLWQTPIPGLAHASPIIWGDRLYVATANKPGESSLKVGLYGDIRAVEENEPHQWHVFALDKATGKVQWKSLAHEAVPRVSRHPKGTHCNSTPATNGKHVVAIFGSEGLFCFNTDGKLLWKKDLGPMNSAFFQSPSDQWGFASSPILHDEKVIVLCDVITNSFLAAFAVADGKELWRTPRQDVPTWGTPTIVSSAGREQVVVNGWHVSGGYDLSTGRNFWRLGDGGDIPVPTPIFAHGLIYLTGAHGRFRPIRAVRPDAAGEITPPDPGQTNAAIVWAHARQGNYMQTPIAVGDLLYACADTGVLTCFDASTGRIHFSERLASGGQGFTSSPVSDGRHIYLASERGLVFVVPVTPVFSVTATNSLGDVCMATPAISSGTLFYRTQKQLIAVGSPR